jgi:hypothetical protein
MWSINGFGVGTQRGVSRNSVWVVERIQEEESLRILDKVAEDWKMVRSVAPTPHGGESVYCEIVVEA